MRCLFSARYHEREPRHGEQRYFREGWRRHLEHRNRRRDFFLLPLAVDALELWVRRFRACAGDGEVAQPVARPPFPGCELREEEEQLRLNCDHFEIARKLTWS